MIIQSNNPKPHIPVLLNEVIENLNLIEGGSYLDCTFGAGGYSKAILESADCNLVALDKDPSVAKFADDIKTRFGDKFKLIQINFADAYKCLNGQLFDGVVLDLGVSSMQLDNADRGFSFQKDGPLDMRMGSDGPDAAYYVNTLSEVELADIIYNYGEEVQSRQIANAIIKTREKKEIKTTYELADTIRSAMHFRKSKIDPVTKTFQALRIYVNQELRQLQDFLNLADKLLNKGGFLLVVSFHSLEDIIVKNYFKQHSPIKIARSKYSKVKPELKDHEWLENLTKKPITPTKDELKNNHRARSSRLRVARKISDGGLK